MNPRHRRRFLPLTRFRPVLPPLLGLLLCLIPACSKSEDLSVAVARCGAATIEVVERYRRQAFSGFTGDTRYVLIVSMEGSSGSTREIDITPVDSVDLSTLERRLPADRRWRALAPHAQVSRRIFVSPRTFSVADYDALAACLGAHAVEINRGFATPRPPIEYFQGEGFRERRAGLRSIVYQDGDWTGNPCQEANTTGFRLACAGLAGFLSVQGHGQIQICVASDAVMPCGRDIGRIEPGGDRALVRPPSRTNRCAQGALDSWLGDDPMRFTRDCRTPSGEALSNLFSLHESESLK